jgi:hypothetical protein
MDWWDWWPSPWEYNRQWEYEEFLLLCPSGRWLWFPFSAFLREVAAVTNIHQLVCLKVWKCGIPPKRQIYTHFLGENQAFILEGYSIFSYKPTYQWEFQDPKMEVLYHTRPYFVGISPSIGHWWWPWFKPHFQGLKLSQATWIFKASIFMDQHWNPALTLVILSSLRTGKWP